MAIFKGFSTQEVDNTTIMYNDGTLLVNNGLSKKFSLTDQNLVIRDLLNALSIRQGEIAGKPAYGTTLWGYLFEPNIAVVRNQMELEIRRVISLDDRLILDNLEIYSRDNEVYLVVELSFVPFNSSLSANIKLSKSSGLASLVS